MSNVSVKAYEAKKYLSLCDYAKVDNILDEIIEFEKPKKRGRKSKLDKTLEELGYTREQMKKFWDDALEVNWKIQVMAENGKYWTDLNKYQLASLVNLKEKTIEQLEEKEEKEKAEKKAREDAEAKKKYYEEHIDEILLDKLLNRKELTNSEYKTLVYEFDVQSNYIDRHRWCMSKEVISCIGNHYFRTVFLEDLGDLGEHQFESYPEEIIWDNNSKTYKKMDGGK